MTYFHKGITRKADGKIGINQPNPTVEFDINGGIKIGGTAIEQEGAIRWNHPNKYYEYYDGSVWKKMGGGEDFQDMPVLMPATPGIQTPYSGVDTLPWSYPLNQYFSYLDSEESATFTDQALTQTEPLHLPDDEA